MIHTKPFAIPKDLAKRAWKEVKSNSGSCGIDGVTLSMYENNLESNLYKLWNRMSSGSYFPQGELVSASYIEAYQQHSCGNVL